MVVVYVVVIILANIITAMFQPITVFNLIIPCGSFLVGATFFLRDIIQLQIGKGNIYKLIVLASVMSGLISISIGDSMSVVLASVASFFVSEALDTEIFTRLSLSIRKRVIISGLFGGFLDSVVFIVLSLSPIGSNVLPWEAVPYAIAGQTLVKCVMQFLLLPIMRRIL